MDAGINNVTYMELYSGPKMANGICGKTIDTGTIDLGSTVFTVQRTTMYNAKNTSATQTQTAAQNQLIMAAKVAYDVLFIMML
jgi:hypothetical protein